MKVRGKTVPLSSEIRSFYLQVGVNLVPPKLRSPMAKQRFSYNQVVTSGLFLTWDPVPGIEEYMVDIKRLRKRKTKDGKSKWSKKEFLSRKVTTSPLKFSNFKPGRYEWVVYSLDKDGKKSKPSEKRRFKVDKIPRVYFVDGPDPTEYLYFTKTPQIYAAWKKSEGITQWRVRYATDGELSDETPWINVNRPILNRSLKAPGRYEVEVEALDKANQPVARSKIKEINVREKPLLPAPEFAESIPDIVKADRRGTVQLRWDPVDGAKKYKLLVKDENGKVTRETVVDRNIASVRRLKPGSYEVNVLAIDEHDRQGPEGEGREMKVPNKSYIKAPKINKIKVK